MPRPGKRFRFLAPLVLFFSLSAFAALIFWRVLPESADRGVGLRERFFEEEESESEALKALALAA